MSQKNILFVTHKKTQCGVYEFGKNIFNVLQNSSEYLFIRLECSSLDELHAAISQYSPDAIIYNYHPSVLPWISKRVAPRIYENFISSVNILQIGIVHEMDQGVANKASNSRSRYIVNGRRKLHHTLFDYYITPDPTLLLKNPVVFKTGRLVPRYQNHHSLPLIPTVGSFGFATPNKGFDKIITLVQNEFDEAVVRLNLPSADFADANGLNALKITEQCKNLVYKKGIALHVTHDYWSNEAMLDFLASNSLNIFLYQDMDGRGVSSTVDNALAVQRPIAISDSIMFRHIRDVEPSICVSKNSLNNIISNGFSPLKKYYNEWNSENLLFEYESILKIIFTRGFKRKRSLI